MRCPMSIRSQIVECFVNLWLRFIQFFQRMGSYSIASVFDIKTGTNGIAHFVPSLKHACLRLKTVANKLFLLNQNDWLMMLHRVVFHLKMCLLMRTQSTALCVFLTANFTFEWLFTGMHSVKRKRGKKYWKSQFISSQSKNVQLT